jgi:hypothetical protein
MDRRDVLKVLPALAVGAALAPAQLLGQTARRRLPLGIQYGGPVLDPAANKTKMEGATAARDRWI